MAVTRIKNNQITDATVDAGTKLVNNSITASKLANNLTYGSDLTITGNLTVQGTATTIDTVDLLVEDPLMILASNQTTGAPTVDIGFIGLRGSSTNIAFVWDESASQFITAYTSSQTTNTVITINSYASFKTFNAEVAGNLAVTGTTSLTGNVSIGNITVGTTKTVSLGDNKISNVADPVGAQDAATKAYVDSVTSSGFTIADDSANTTVVSGGDTLTLNGTADEVTVAITGVDTITFGLPNAVTVANTLTAGNVSTAGFASATGNITAGNIITGGTASATGTITGGNLATGGTASVTGTVTAGNLATAGTASAGGNVTGANLITGGLVSATGSITSGSTISATANITAGNIITGGQVSATGNITGANLISAVVTNSAAMTISTTAGNINLNPTGNIVLNSKYINGLNQPVQDNDAASKIYVDNMASTQLAYHQGVSAATPTTLATITGGTITYTQPNGVSNGVGAVLSTTGSFNLIDTANVQTVGTRILVKNEANAVYNGVYTYANTTAIIRSTDADEYGPNSVTQLSINDYFFVANGDVNKGSAWICDAPTGTITFGTSNISFAQFSSSQTYTANTSAGLALNSTTFSAKVDNNTTAFDGSGNIVVKTSANLTTPNIGAATGTSLSVSGTVTAGNLATAGTASAGGNVTGGNIGTGGLITATGTITSATTITGGNLATGGTASATGTITGGNLATAGTASAGGNVTGANLVTGGVVTATGTITGGNLATAGTASAGGNVTGANLVTGGVVTATGTITGGNLATGGTASATGTITGGNLATGGTASVTGNITGGNITTAGQANLGNIRISGDDITDTNGRVNFNTAGADVDFAVNGDTVANVFYVDAGVGTASFGNSTQITNAIAAFQTTTSIKLPVGTTGERPGTGVTGMVRFNTSVNNLEFYDANSWQTAGSQFTVITANTQSGNGVQTAFTLPASSTTAGTIVAINGVVQIPVTAYSVANVTCTFTEAPASTDVIDFRVLATTSTVTGLSSSSGAIVELDPTAIEVDVTGNIIPSANVTYSLGNSTNRWSNVISSVFTAGTITASSTISATGNITGGNLSVGTGTITGGNIVNANGNGVGNIGSSSVYFNTVFAKATSAQYADLAEKYVADAEYAPGTVLTFGGDKEVTLSTEAGSTRVAGVVSTNPSYIMNAGLTAEHVAMVALQGRVPCRVVGPVVKGDLMVAAGNGAAQADNAARAGTIIGKALENFDGAEGTIEVVIGRN